MEKMRKGTKGGCRVEAEGRRGKGSTRRQARVRVGVEGAEDGGRLAQAQRRLGARDVRRCVEGGMCGACGRR
jgi:hypothetical protein